MPEYQSNMEEQVDINNSPNKGKFYKSIIKNDINSNDNHIISEIY